MKRLVWLLSLLTLFLLAGCSVSNLGTAEDRETVTVALWGDQLTEGYGQYLQEAFPEVNFIFYGANNSTSFYKFKYENGDLPDILTVRRFSLRDVAGWRGALMDLSDTDLANTFPQSYLRSYTYSDGSVNWLPACAEVDGIIANKTLLDACGVSVPGSYEEFVAACRALSGQGVRPFVSNFSADYTCMEILQGLSAAQLTSQEGREWRQLYESGQIDQLSEEVWLPVFQRMRDFIEYTGLSAADAEDGLDVFGSYEANETAMIRGTGAEASWYNEDRESVLLPYFGAAGEDSWYLTYPAFQVAASAAAEKSPQRKELILDIIEAMLSEEGLQSISNQQNMIPYNKGVEIELSPALSYMEPVIAGNRLYIRLASSDMFAVSRQVVQGMLSGTYFDARSAFDAFNEALRLTGTQAPDTAHIDVGYDYAFSPDGGSPAASAVMNTVREELNVPLLLGQSINVAGEISAGDYTQEELRFLTIGEGMDIRVCSMTGEQLYQYVNYVLTAPGKRGSVINDSSLYVSSGFEMEIRKTGEGYILERLTADGEALDRDQTYEVAVIGSGMFMIDDAMAVAGITSYTAADAKYQQIVADRLAAGGQLAHPTDYITLRQ